MVLARPKPKGIVHCHVSLCPFVFVEIPVFFSQTFLVASEIVLGFHLIFSVFLQFLLSAAHTIIN